MSVLFHKHVFFKHIYFSSTIFRFPEDLFSKYHLIYFAGSDLELIILS